jgi:hypothetical protein
MTALNGVTISITLDQFRYIYATKNSTSVMLRKSTSCDFWVSLCASSHVTPEHLSLSLSILKILGFNFTMHIHSEPKYSNLQYKNTKHNYTRKLRDLLPDGAVLLLLTLIHAADTALPCLLLTIYHTQFLHNLWITGQRASYPIHTSKARHCHVTTSTTLSQLKFKIHVSITGTSLCTSHQNYRLTSSCVAYCAHVGKIHAFLTSSTCAHF